MAQTGLVARPRVIDLVLNTRLYCLLRYVFRPSALLVHEAQPRRMSLHRGKRRLDGRDALVREPWVEAAPDVDVLDHLPARHDKPRNLAARAATPQYCRFHTHVLSVL